MSVNFMSDSDDEEADFTASEDEWLPEKSNPSHKDPDLSESESEENFTDGGEESDINERRQVDKFRKTTPESRKPRPVKTKLTMMERKTLYEKYRAIRKSDHKSLIAKCDDSESSGDEHLVEPDKLDLNSDFFASTASQGPSNVPNFDCNAGMLTDSSEDDLSKTDEKTKRETNKKLIARINQTSQSYVQFAALNEFNNKMEQAKSNASSFNAKEAGTDNSTDIGVLLAMGEQPDQSSSKSSQKAKRNKNDSDSDWEEVEDKNEACHQQDLQITFKLDSREAQKKKRSNEIYMEACIKRIINREKRENQYILHKVNILMGIAHGNYVNSVLNSTKLLSLALTMIPSQKCYPKDRTDLEYFEQIVRFYRQIVDLKDKRVYSRFKKLPSLETSLRLQMLTKAAICKRDFVLIFIILLRAVGVQCRLVMSLIVVPKKLPQSELHQSDVAKKEPPVKEQKNIASKPVDSTGDKETKKTNDQKNASRDRAKTKSKRKRMEHPKIPQMDGNDDIPIKRSKLTAAKDKLDVSQNALSTKESPADSTSKSSTSQLQEISLFSPRKTRKQRQNELVSESKTSKANTYSATTSSSSIVPKTDSNVKLHSKLKDNKGDRKADVQSTNREPKLSKNSGKHANISDDGAVQGCSKNQSGSNKISPDSKPKAIHPKTSVTEMPTRTVKKSPKSSKPSVSFESESPRIVKIEYVDKHLKRRLDRRVLSTDDECTNAQGVKPKSKSGVNLWIEVYAEEEEQWIPVDVTSGKVHCLDHIVKLASAPLVYVLAWNNDGTIKDVTTRYCPNYATSTKKLRVEQDWLNKALGKFKGKRTARDIEEDRCLNQAQLEQPLPTTISEFKNHPLYALKRHLLKFEAIYPPEAPTLGFIRDEPVYARECVHTLHSRDLWLKQARTVKLFETPYKVVTARPKYDRASGQMLPAQPLELFGYWQTQDYEPPTAEDGIVPRNAYGNVELFKACMLPKKTVHLQLPALNRICKKLGIDCAQAVTGFDFHSGSTHPVYDGFVVCEEYKDLVIDAWYQEQEQEEKREREKFEKRVYGNWKKLIKGLLIRRKLQNKYNFDNLSG
ncbi:DNA repair protein complementing XP-C cells homolog [Topomyia yanbarensis]|uniref:DNA repair protein complementing XP-C cells homolog n=1 Tax=Topomyia yanbarensis TaxID=2498891 RepID=UPI00273BA34A|nr:DNA repair protein complementing XP-C cells homolog [Topomyia yanbarensis]